MKALKYPFHIDLQGHIATTDDYAEIVTGQLIDVLMSNSNERVMRALYGSNLQAALHDPSDDLVRSDAARIVIQRIQQWAPRVTLVSAGFTADDQFRPGVVWCDVIYKAGTLAQAQALRLPVSNYLSEETPV